MASRARGAERELVDAVSVSPGACFDRSALAARIAALRASDRVDDRILADVRIDGDVAIIAMVGPSAVGPAASVRRLPIAGASCADQTSAVALAIALAIDAAIAPPPAPPAPPRRPPPVTPPTPDFPPEFDHPEPKKKEPPSTFGVGAAADIMALIGPMPVPILGVAPSLELSITRGLEARAGLFVTTSADISFGNVVVAASLLTADIQGCAAFHWGGRFEGERLRRFRFQACAGILAGTFQTSTTKGRSQVLVPGWFATQTRLALRAGVTDRFGLELGLRAVVPFTRTEIDALDSQNLITGIRYAGNVAGAFELGPHFAFF